ncbi:diacylglycerol O-acyltransferase 2-like isoform X1 [Petromyzon marinus]|uniref:diacylglycerol O-acyltransferase 2-like isoform X1 n=1 Tax=Petromyzon marinus TaxID=7757 RepID=UPI003F6E7163
MKTIIAAAYNSVDLAVGSGGVSGGGVSGVDGERDNGACGKWSVPGARGVVHRLRSHVEALAVLQWELTFLLAGVVCPLLMVVLLCTALWPVATLYLAWLVLDGRTPHRGGRRTNWVRNWDVWNYFRDYFPIKLVKTCELSPSRNFVIGYHPHGVMCIGAFINFCTEATGFAQLFPGIHSYVATLAGNFRIPLYREYLMAGCLCPVSRGAIDHLLSRGPPGNAVVIVVGGAAESLQGGALGDSHHRVVLKGRKGFVRIALQQGADLVPVYSFGEGATFKQLVFAEGTWKRRAQVAFQKAMGFAPCIFHGRAVLNPDSWGVLPLPTPILTVVGEPITVPHIPEPTAEEVDRYHALYVSGLQRVFNAHKVAYGLAESDNLIIQ